MSKLTKSQKEFISEISREALNGAGKSIRDCSFVGVQYDAKAVNAIETIAQGLVENAKALGALAQILRASNVEIQAMVRMDSK